MHIIDIRCECDRVWIAALSVGT